MTMFFSNDNFFNIFIVVSIIILCGYLRRYRTLCKKKKMMSYGNDGMSLFRFSPLKFYIKIILQILIGVLYVLVLSNNDGWSVNTSYLAASLLIFLICEPLLSEKK